MIATSKLALRRKLWHQEVAAQPHCWRCWRSVHHVDAERPVAAEGEVHLGHLELVLLATRPVALRNDRNEPRRRPARSRKKPAHPSRPQRRRLHRCLTGPRVMGKTKGSASLRMQSPRFSAPSQLVITNWDCPHSPCGRAGLYAPELPGCSAITQIIDPYLALCQDRARSSRRHVSRSDPHPAPETWRKSSASWSLG